MFFLIVYDRPKGTLLTFKKFKSSERDKAEKERLQIELDLNRKKNSNEVVLLEAENQSKLKLTHARYFESLRAIINSTAPLNS